MQGAAMPKPTLIISPARDEPSYVQGATEDIVSQVLEAEKRLDEGVARLEAARTGAADALAAAMAGLSLSGLSGLMVTGCDLPEAELDLKDGEGSDLLQLLLAVPTNLKGQADGDGDAIMKLSEENQKENHQTEAALADGIKEGATAAHRAQQVRAAMKQQMVEETAHATLLDVARLFLKVSPPNPCSFIMCVMHLPCRRARTLPAPRACRVWQRRLARSWTHPLSPSWLLWPRFAMFCRRCRWLAWRTQEPRPAPSS
jgi:hypothetical protein